MNHEEVIEKISKCDHSMYKVEVDFSDPIWCAKCNINFDMEDLPLSSGLKNSLDKWSSSFQNKALSDNLSADAVAELNQEGEMLLAKIQAELGKVIPVIFEPLQVRPSGWYCDGEFY